MIGIYRYILVPFSFCHTMSHHVAPCHDVTTMSHHQFHVGHLLIEGDVFVISMKVWRCLKYTSICLSQGLWRGARLAWPQSFGVPLPLKNVSPVQQWDTNRLHMTFYLEAWRVRPTWSDLLQPWNHALCVLCVLIHGFTVIYPWLPSPVSHSYRGMSYLVTCFWMDKGNQLPLCLSWLVIYSTSLLFGGNIPHHMIYDIH